MNTKILEKKVSHLTRAKSLRENGNETKARLHEEHANIHYSFGGEMKMKNGYSSEHILTNREKQKNSSENVTEYLGTSVPPETPTHHLGLWANIKHLLGITEASGRPEKDTVISEEDKLKAIALASREVHDREVKLWSGSKGTRQYSSYRPEHVKTGECFKYIRRKVFEKLQSILAQHVEFAQEVESDIWFVVYALLDDELEDYFTPVSGYWGEQYFPNSYYLLGRHYKEKDGTVNQIYVQLSSNGIVCDTPDGFRKRGWIDANDLEKKTLNGALFNLVVSEAIKMPRELIKALKDAKGLSNTERIEIKTIIRQEHINRMKRLSQKLRGSDDYYSII